MSRLSYIFIGQFVPESDANTNSSISQAGNNYQHKLIRILRPKKVFSFVPIFFNNKINCNKKNIVYLRSFSKFISSRIYRLFLDTLSLIYKLRKSRINNILFYNIDKQTFLSVFLTKYLLKKNVFIILADNPNFRGKSFFDKLINYLTLKIDGVLVFNGNSLVNKNQQLLHGIIEESNLIINDTKPNNNVIFSGSLGNTTGFELVLETISKRSDINLYITGKPYDYTNKQFETLIESYDKFININYLGLLDYQEYQDVLSKCDIALSLRNPSDEEHQYNFPSKILEYLSKSKFVISTLDYKGFSNKYLFKTEFNSSSLNSTLNKIYALEQSEVLKIKRDIFIYLKNNYTNKQLVDKINLMVSNNNEENI
jgi:hypothetical protein